MAVKKLSFFTATVFLAMTTTYPKNYPLFFCRSYPKNEKLADYRPTKGRSVSVKLNIGNCYLIGFSFLIMREGGDILRELKRTPACLSIYARAAALNMVESVSGDATVRKERWQLTGTVEVYGNKSRIILLAVCMMLCLAPNNFYSCRCPTCTCNLR